MKDDLQTLLTETKRICEAATPGIWRIMGVDSHVLGNSIVDAIDNGTPHHQWTHNTTEGNAAFIAHARTALPRLVAALELAVSQRDDAMQAEHFMTMAADTAKLNLELARVLRGES